MAEADSSPSLEGLIGSRARGDNGRYVSVTPTEEKPPEPVKVAEAAPTPAKAPEPVVTPTPAAPVAAPVTQPTTPTENAEAAAYKKAMREEREKRQAAERRLAELQTPKEPVDPWQDLPGALKSQQQALDERLFAQTCAISERFARTQHKDYDEVREVFLEAAKERPVLFEQMRQSEDPATFAYGEGLRIRELKDVNGDFTAYKSKLEKDIEARLTAQFEAKYGVKPTPAVPVSLNSDSSPAVATEVYAGPPPLNKILRNASRS